MPPKPRLVLRIGVTGHRPNRFPPAGQAAVRGKLDTLFTTLRDRVTDLHRREAGYFSSEAPEIRVVSSLAEGADRIVADAGSAAGFALDAVLPFAADSYEADFDDGAKRHFRDMLDRARVRFTLPGARTGEDPAAENRAYEAAGLVMLRQCDLLIAVWDGKVASGRGGTEDIVQRAVESGRPVLWFDPEGNGPYLLVASGMAPSDARDLAARARSADPASETEFAEVAESLLAPPCQREGDGLCKTARQARSQLLRFLGERERRFILLDPWYPLLLSLFSDKRGFLREYLQKPFLAGTIADWSDYWKALEPAPESVRRPLHETLMPRFAWADKLANHYGTLHRSGYVRNYLLAAMAVLFAAIGGKICHVAEFVTIALITIMTSIGIAKHWHQRWIDYRNLSAQLRHMRALSLVGSNGSEFTATHAGEEMRPGPMWVNWYCRATARQIGLIDATFDADAIKTARAAIREGEVRDQLGYHIRNARRMHTVAAWLDRLSILSFAATFLICGYEAAEEFGHHMSWLPTAGEELQELFHILTVVLPAFGAALFGIRMYGDFEGAKDRSADMVRRLGGLIGRLHDGPGMTFAELSAITEYTAIVMAGEIGDWSYVYRGRPLALPT